MESMEQISQRRHSEQQSTSSCSFVSSYVFRRKPSLANFLPKLLAPVFAVLASRHRAAALGRASRLCVFPWRAHHALGRLLWSCCCCRVSLHSLRYHALGRCDIFQEPLLGAS